jgi:cyanophycin synthetase
MLAHIQKMNGHTVGLTTTDGVYIDGERTVSGDMTGPRSAQIVLRDPSVDLAVLETARGGLLRAGLGYRHCDVGAVLNVSEDHLGDKGVETLEQLAEVKRIVVEVARDCAVLNADDLSCLKMADHTKASRIAYVTMNARHELVRKHIRAGGLAGVLEEGINGHMITLYDKGTHMPLLWTHLIPATFEGKALHNVQNAMFAAVMAYAMGVKVDNIRQGLRTFDTSYFQVPGRTNVFTELPFKVIVDYGHNAAAVKTMTDFALRLECTGRRICVLAAPGDRRDEDVRAIARAASKGFDHIFLRRDDDLRGRGPNDVPRMMEEELLRCGSSHGTPWGSRGAFRGQGLPDLEAGHLLQARVARGRDRLHASARAERLASALARAKPCRRGCAPRGSIGHPRRARCSHCARDRRLNEVHAAR